ncbi:ergothioneine biosynthesis protein EgtC [Aphanothece hegewaldii CCALA 016]|uniref:Ergothioneine biosynthesis protein EgtC n=1 Tax=Aphanothece hegewaldii CCALA 016 TaxID=2107694 RepID=A0A2T1LXM3_9CHRO|nr:ergothioneine biosynthesis protein EgtC [Aphanothece hegewaldii]PSF37135.1 ergothioneine biosynthesis protein EgtC [Aphanothece hegewaldii CCALA 016]
MCRLLGYIGSPLHLEKILDKPEHSLIVQSYQPREMTSGVVNADGFGLGWYNAHQDTLPYIYKNILPIWNDVNLPYLNRYVESGCVLAYVRSATPPNPVDYSNCQPFIKDKILFIHNGFIHNFRQTLYRPIRNVLSDEIYQFITGTTDSEHIYGLILNELQKDSNTNLTQALQQTLVFLTDLAKHYHVFFSANIILSDGKQLVASRYSNRNPTPTLYWLKNDSLYPNGGFIASEPIFQGDWNRCSEGSIITIGENLDVNISPII